MVRFNANLSSTSLENLIKNLSDHSRKLVDSQRDVLQALADYVYDRIREYVPVKTGQLKDSFIKEVSNDVAKVYTDLFYAKYVEFGTGVSGENSAYDTKYIVDRALEYSPDIQGQVAHKFIYHAVQDLENDYVDIVKNVLREKGLI